MFGDNLTVNQTLSISSTLIFNAMGLNKVHKHVSNFGNNSLCSSCGLVRGWGRRLGTGRCADFSKIQLKQCKIPQTLRSYIISMNHVINIYILLVSLMWRKGKRWHSSIWLKTSANGVTGVYANPLRRGLT